MEKHLTYNMCLIKLFYSVAEICSLFFSPTFSTFIIKYKYLLIAFVEKNDGCVVHSLTFPPIFVVKKSIRILDTIKIVNKFKTVSKQTANDYTSKLSYPT